MLGGVFERQGRNFHFQHCRSSARPEDLFSNWPRMLEDGEKLTELFKPDILVRQVKLQ